MIRVGLRNLAFLAAAVIGLGVFFHGVVCSELVLLVVRFIERANRTADRTPCGLGSFGIFAAYGAVVPVTVRAE